MQKRVIGSYLTARDVKCLYRTVLLLLLEAAACCRSCTSLSEIVPCSHPDAHSFQYQSDCVCLLQGDPNWELFVLSRAAAAAAAGSCCLLQIIYLMRCLLLAAGDGNCLFRAVLVLLLDAATADPGFAAALLEWILNLTTELQWVLNLKPHRNSGYSSVQQGAEILMVNTSLHAIHHVCCVMYQNDVLQCHSSDSALTYSFVLG